ncbi:hypothetical protein [Halobacillus salinus]|uniref:Amino acid transporter n=1 Tax=Halobacillus salinus TaxID=192814 RepID=A0A4Z0GZH7_9BACI|nr:hypothetical protein [Halobacillus salinus]TGB02916.1 hypothetical protein E4663_12260 [Halobacillus salinus]
MSHGNQNKPFNDVIAHQQNIEGYPKTRGGRLPKPIKFIGYFLFGTFALLMLFGFIANILLN